MLTLLAILATATAAQPAKMQPDPVRGEELYRELCWECHGAQGLGDGPAAAGLGTASPPLAGRYPQPTWSDNIDIILAGKGDMPGFSTQLGRPDSRRILLWLVSLNQEGVPKREAARARLEDRSPDDDEGEGAR